MIGDITQVALGGVLALFIIREVFRFVKALKTSEGSTTMPAPKRRPTTDRVKRVEDGVGAVASRLDRIIERLEDIAESTRATKKQTQITGELAERIVRHLDKLEEQLHAFEASARRRTTGSHPAI